MSPRDWRVGQILKHKYYDSDLRYKIIDILYDGMGEVDVVRTRILVRDRSRVLYKHSMNNFEVVNEA